MACNMHHPVQNRKRSNDSDSSGSASSQYGRLGESTCCTDQQFTYDHLEGDQIRVLTLEPGSSEEDISCRLSTVSLSSRPQIETLSYCWGSQDLAQPLLLNGQAFSVTENLYSALFHLRLQNRPLYLWVDALCINQEDVFERSSQVEMMREIFKSCTCVYVWLGEPTLSRLRSSTPESVSPKVVRVDSGMDCGSTYEEEQQVPHVGDQDVLLSSDSDYIHDCPFFLLEHFANDNHLYDLPGFQHPRCGPVVVDESPFLRMYQILTKDWWRRLWCVQEILLAPDAIVVYGQWRMPWSMLKLASINHRRHVSSCCSETQMLMPAKLWHVRDDDVVEKAGDCQYRDLDRVLRLYSHRGCQDPRDKVFGLLGLVDMSKYPTLVPDYTKDYSDVCYDTTIALHQYDSTSLKFLTGLRSPNNGLPSWVRDLANMPDMITTWFENHRFDIYNYYTAAATTPAHISIQNRNLLRLRGIKVSTIKHIGKARNNVNLGDALPTFESWLKLASLEVPTVLNDMRDPKQRSFWRVLTADMALDFDSTGANYVWSRCTAVDMQLHLDAITRFYFNFKFSSHRKACPQPSISKILTAVTIQKAFFLADEEYMGLCYSTAKPGDEIWVLRGGNVPFVLRKASGHVESERFQLVGDCYLDGFMDGEAFSIHANEEQDVILF